jgi:RNA polymerase sigma factor for flagellar operon FliA
MPEQSPHEALFIENLALIDRIVASVARRQGLGRDDAADFASWIKLKLIESDYAALRKFRGESSIGTYLTVVIAMLARDYRVQRWGRWRPSAIARRKGTIAVRLEALVHRQGYRLDHAAELLRTSGETDLSDRELARLMSELPQRQPLRPVEVGAEALAFVEDSSGADVAVKSEDAERGRLEAQQALQRVIDAFAVEDRMVIRLRYWEGLSVAMWRVAWDSNRKTLYRRIDRLLALIRQKLVDAGMTEDRLNDLLREPAP